MRLIIIGSVLFILGLELSIPENRGSLSFTVQELFRVIGIDIRNRGFSNIFSSFSMLIGLPLAFRGVAQLTAELMKNAIEPKASSDTTPK